MVMRGGDKRIIQWPSTEEENPEFFQQKGAKFGKVNIGQWPERQFVLFPIDLK